VTFRVIGKGGDLKTLELTRPALESHQNCIPLPREGTEWKEFCGGTGRRFKENPLFRMESRLLTGVERKVSII